MKNLTLFSIFLIFFCGFTYAQNFSIEPNRGISMPKMSTSVRNAIGSPTAGLMIYNNESNKFNYFDGTAWQEAFFGNQWSVNGTKITYSGGFVGIGIANPTRNLVVNSDFSTNILIQQGAFTGVGVNDGFLLGSNLSVEGEIWNFENAGIRFGTNNLERMKISFNGNVGIGASTPTEKLDVVGNIKVSGEINRTATGSTNLVPIAFGMIQDNNTIISGSGNFTITDMGTGHKQITVNGVTLSIGTHTVVGSTFAATPRFSSYLIITGELEVFTYNSSSTLVNTPFSFVIYGQ